jgi:hypothetical protein
MGWMDVEARVGVHVAHGIYISEEASSKLDQRLPFIPSF